MIKNIKNKSKKVEDAHRINDRIRIDEVRLVGDNVNNPGEVIKTYKALELAKSMELDLVEISPSAKPPVVKILDYKKFLYEEKKHKKELEKKQKETNKPIKEIRLTPNISDNDLNTKKKKLEEFINDGHKVKLVIRYKGREMYVSNAKERGEILLLQIAETFSDNAKVEALPKLQGKNMFMTLSPLPSSSTKSK